ncbi:MAG: serpin family protein [Mollicutes bacterium]|nr:serpin family protein [Mollicutes bacterium]
MFSIIVIMLIGTVIYNLSIKKESILDNTSRVKEINETEETNNEEDNFELEVNNMSGNGIEDFDFSFLQLENKKENIIYSPLSIKYALKMLEEGSAGNSKEQISNLIGNYITKKYINSPNMSIANALFIRNTFKKNINNNYISILEDKYNAEIIYDSFVNTNNLDSWTKNKTFGLIDKLFDDLSQTDFVLVNALAIDMEWKNLIQSTYEKGIVYRVSYHHEDFWAGISELDEYNYPSLDFNNNLINAKAVEIGAAINNYDIITELGEKNIRETVGDKYEKWLADGCCGEGCEEYPNVNKYLDKYISELASNYKRVDSSTDFLFHSDDEINVFC